MFYLISNYICVYIDHYDSFYYENKGCAQRFIDFLDEKLKLRVQIEGGLIYIMN